MYCKFRRKYPLFYLLLTLAFIVFLTPIQMTWNTPTVTQAQVFLNDKLHPISATDIPTSQPMMHQSTFAQTGAIWVHDQPPDAHEVVLFRHTFVLDTPLTNTEFVLFADTRYEAWINGTWIGRGPARFSRHTREYDVYDLGTLAPGSHLIAVKVQWAPNYRRSESTIPLLQAYVQGKDGERSIVVAQTGSHWKAQRSTAWQPDAVPVHSWNLIGPTELLDLRKLSHDWMHPTFDDTHWSGAVVTDLPTATYKPRSIPSLINIPLPLTVQDAGKMAPERIIGEVIPSDIESHIIEFSVQSTTDFIIEAITTSDVMLTETVRLDGMNLVWQSDHSWHPDIYIATRGLEPGTHILTFADLPTQGLTFSLPRHDIVVPDNLLQQGLHAGRRLLLADLVSQPDVVDIQSDQGISLTFTDAPAYVVLDLGRVVHGRVVAEVSGSAGTVIDMGWDERLWENRRPLPYPGSLHPQWNQTDSWILDASPRSITTIDARSGRYILIAVWGNPVEINNIQVYEERYPVVQLGTFVSDQPALNHIWQIGIDTLYSNMTDAYADPWRERGQWWGDAYVADHVNQVAFGDTQLLRRGLFLMAEAFEDGRPNALAPHGTGNYLYDYGMLWVKSVNDYWRQTGDVEVLRQVYPVVIDFMRYLEQYKHADTGLLDIPFNPPSRMFYIDTSTYYDRYGQSTAVNAYYYATLLEAATIAERIGMSTDAVTWRQQAEMLKTQVNHYLYRPDQGRYIQTLLEGVAREPSVQAQVWTLAFDLVPDDQTEPVADAILELLATDPSIPNIQVYGMFWVFEALARVGRQREALEIIERYHGRLIDLGATTWWEHFNAHNTYKASLSHGWGGSPTWFLTTHVLGLRRTGTDTWLLRPGLGSVGYAEGALPWQESVVQARWQSSGCQPITVNLKAPRDTRGEVVIPLTDATMILTLNGATVWQDGQALIDGIQARPDGIRIVLTGGEYAIKIDRVCYPVFLPLIQR